MTKITQLIDTFIPEHYALDLTLERLTRKFHGKVTIQGHHVNPDSPISLHSKKLVIKKALINSLPVDTKQEINDELMLLPHSKLTEKDVEIVLEFEGTITDAQHGLYASYYEHDGEKKELLATQLEPHHAREIFPCVDEPAAKATFELTLTTENNVTVLGNMPIKTQQEKTVADLGYLITSFETTPKMSTYLLAFVVGELHSVEAKSNNNIDVRVWSTLSQPKESLQYALETAVRTIDFFEDYFGYGYPLPKADHIALPDMGGGAAAAMENWGLITYREDYLVCDSSSGISVEQRIARVIIHETSHQWFGNLVTMKWWDDLWLNESFASLMEYIGLDALFPEWHYWEQFPLSETMPALRRDSNSGVQSIKTPVNHPDEIGTLFDGAIVYAKGATVLNMVRVYIGDEVFQHGLKRYFETHAYDNTVGNDLWNALGSTVASFITPWLEQSGYPVVSVKRDGASYHLSQSQFLVGNNVSSKKQWPIPLYATDSSVPSLLEQKSVTFDNQQPLQFNKGGFGQYIVNYDTLSREYLLQKIQTLNTIDRVRFLLETTLLMRTDYLATDTLINTLQAYEGEHSQPVWEIMSYAISDLKKFVEHDKLAEAGLKKLVKTLSAEQYKQLGWVEKDSESSGARKLRADIIGLSLYSESEDAISHALSLYDAHNDDIVQINGELRGLVLVAAVRHHKDQRKVIDALLKIHDTTTNSELQEDIITGLSGTNNPKVIAELLEIMKDASRVRPQNAVHWYIYCLRNKHGKSLAWQWIQDNWDWVKATYGSDKSYDIFPRVLGTILNTSQELEEYSQFFKQFENEPALARTISIAKGEIKARAEWIEQDKNDVIKKLRQL